MARAGWGIPPIARHLVSGASTILLESLNGPSWYGCNRALSDGAVTAPSAGAMVEGVMEAYVINLKVRIFARWV